MSVVQRDHQEETCSVKLENQKLPFEISNEAKELVKSAELLSRKRKKYHITSIWKERG